jgi:hypothetical protein
VLVVAHRGSVSSAVYARCRAASRSRGSSATSALAVSRIASAWGVDVVVYDHSLSGDGAWFRFAFKWTDARTGEARVRGVCRPIRRTIEIVISYMNITGDDRDREAAFVFRSNRAVYFAENESNETRFTSCFANITRCLSLLPMAAIHSETAMRQGPPHSQIGHWPRRSAPVSVVTGPDLTQRLS